jgi:hypothetical protein
LALGVVDVGLCSIECKIPRPIRFTISKVFIFSLFLYERQMRSALHALAIGMGSGYGGLNRIGPLGSSEGDVLEAGSYPCPIWENKI